MIAIRRTKEPAWLESVRIAEVQRVTDALASGSALSSELVGTEYRKAADDLWRMQHRKCCYCESQIPLAFNDVEHYRPKAEARQGRRKKADAGYWWLAWTWSNLLYACPSCNRTAKNNQFPLAPPAIRLSPMETPPGGEVPLLLDPSEPGADPEPHFTFEFNGLRRGHITGATERGSNTIDTCQLHRDELVELRAVVVELLERKLDKVTTHLTADDVKPALAAWRILLDDADPGLPYSALRRARLEAYWDALTAERQGILPRPPARLG